MRLLLDCVFSIFIEWKLWLKMVAAGQWQEHIQINILWQSLIGIAYAWAPYKQHTEQHSQGETASYRECRCCCCGCRHSHRCVVCDFNTNPTVLGEHCKILIINHFMSISKSKKMPFHFQLPDFVNIWQLTKTRKKMELICFPNDHWTFKLRYEQKNIKLVKTQTSDRFKLFE